LVSSFAYVVALDGNAARLLVEKTLHAHGFDVLMTPAGGFIATSSNTSDGFLGGLFGSSRPRTSFVVEITERANTDDSQQIVRWNSSSPRGVITGKLAGENPSDRLFLGTADVLNSTFTAAGILIETIVDSPV
jgi:hypothetical protein